MDPRNVVGRGDENPFKRFLPPTTTVRWLLIAALFLAGCAAIRNTPEQDYVYEMARPCEGKGVRLDYVSPDGKQWRGLAIHGASTVPEFNECVRDNVTRTPFSKWKRDNKVN